MVARTLVVEMLQSALDAWGVDGEVHVEADGDAVGVTCAGFSPLRILRDDSAPTGVGRWTLAAREDDTHLLGRDEFCQAEPYPPPEGVCMTNRSPG